MVKVIDCRGGVSSKKLCRLDELAQQHEVESGNSANHSVWGALLVEEQLLDLGEHRIQEVDSRRIQLKIVQRFNQVIECEEQDVSPNRNSGGTSSPATSGTSPGASDAIVTWTGSAGTELVCS